ncbi:hypothetical protein D3C85_851440 [compost metagenome]
MGALGFQDRGVERLVISFQGGLQLIHAGSQGAVTGHLGLLGLLDGRIERLVIGHDLGLQLGHLLGQRLIPLRLGALGFQDSGVERLIIPLQGGLQLGHPLSHGLIGGAQGAVALLQGGTGLAVCRLVIGLELADLPGGGLLHPGDHLPHPGQRGGRRRLLPFELGTELGHLTGQRLVFVCLGILTASDRGAGLASPVLTLLICQSVADAGQGGQIDFCGQVILASCQRLALL